MIVWIIFGLLFVMSVVILAFCVEKSTRGDEDITLGVYIEEATRGEEMGVYKNV